MPSPRPCAATVLETLRSTACSTPGQHRGDDRDRARTTGALLARARSKATIDALVVAEAIERGGGVVLTGDAHDLGVLADRHSEVVIQPL